MKLNDNSGNQLFEILKKAEKVPISSIPHGNQDKYQYMRELISSLGEDEAIQVHAPNVKVAGRLTSKWKQLAIGRQPHIQKVRQGDGSYLVYLWLGGDKKGVTRLTQGDTADNLHEVLKKARKVRISSIPNATESKYQYMEELLSSLGEREAIELHAHDSKEANTLRSRWGQLAVGHQPHTQKVRQGDGSYLVYLWLGQTVLDEILKISHRVRRGVRRPWNGNEKAANANESVSHC